ncbi:MAG: S-layer protein [Candidatus Nanohalobium sp.]
MKSIKKLKKYGIAAAGTALLVGATLSGAAAQTSGSSGDSSMTLGDYPQPFVADDGTVQSSIVVGSDAKVTDVVSAIDVAGTLSQAAFTEKAVKSGGSTAGVTGVSKKGDIRGTVGGELSAFDYDKFTVGQMEDEEGDAHYVTEGATFGANSRINGTSAQADLDSGAVTYKVEYSPSFAVNDTITLLGNEYEITSATSSKVELGSTKEMSQLGLDETFTHGPYTVKVEDFNKDAGTVLVQVSKNGETLKMTGMDSTGNNGEKSITVGEDNDFSVTAESIYFGSQGNYITLSSTYTDTILEDGEDAPMDSDYKVSLNSGSGTVSSITLNSQVTTASEADKENDQIEYLEEGDTFAGPADYFEFVNQGLSPASMTDVDFKADQKVSFMTPKGTEQTVQFSSFKVDSADGAGDGTYNLSKASEGDWIPINSTNTGDDNNYDFYAVKVTSTGDTVTLQHGDYSWDVDMTANSPSLDSGAPGFDITVTDGNLTHVPNKEIVTTQFGGELTTTTVNSNPTAVFDEGTGSTDAADNTYKTKVVYENSSSFSNADTGEIGRVNVTDSGSEVQSFDLGNKGSTISNYGSKVSLGSATSAQIDYASEKRSVKFGLGEKSASASTGEVTTMKPAGWGDVGKLDTSENIGQVKQNDNLILVGGPSVNDLTQQLAQEDMTMTEDKWVSGDYEGTSILQLTEGFDGEGGNKALVVAGHQGEDTNAAAEYLANYESHQEALSGKEKVKISTETGQVVS